MKKEGRGGSDEVDIDTSKTFVIDEHTLAHLHITLP